MDQRPSSSTRRQFLKSASVTAATLCASRMAGGAVHVSGSDVLRIGLVGCGGRGSGAVVNALAADAQSRLVAMADVFAWRITESLQGITAEYQQRIGADAASRLDVPAERQFVGLDACAQLLASGVDVVLITVPSHFTPLYLKAAIDAGKHVFCEKTHAVDGPGVRLVTEATEQARRKGLSVVSGLAWRYDTGVQETMKRVHDGAIGEIRAVQEICNTASLRSLPRRPGMTEMEYQLHNWYDFNWLSADLPGLNLVHNVDKGAWALHDEPPLKAWGMGGREVRKGPTFGDVFDHHATVFEYASGVHMFAYCRQISGTQTDVSDVFIGTDGICHLLRNTITGKVNWRYEGAPCNRFDLEHVALFRAIRSGTPLNNGVYMARSSLLALMSTWCSHTGEEITWDAAMGAQKQVNPARYALDASPPVLPGPDGNYPIAVPGLTRFDQ